MPFELVWSNKIRMYVLVSSSIPYCVLCSCFHFPFFSFCFFVLAIPLLLFSFSVFHLFSFFGVSDGKESACSAGDLGSVPGSGRYHEEGNGYPLHYSCLERSLAGYSPWGCKELDTTEWLTHTHSDSQTIS